MSKKRIKQYLMLLTVIGLVSIASGSGTFASFSAQTTNSNNVFAAGTLYLHDSVNGNTACKSESQTTGTINIDPSGCDALFTANLANGATTADLALSNAGSLPSNDLEFKVGNCTWGDNGQGPSGNVHLTFITPPATCNGVYITIQETDSGYGSDTYCAYGTDNSGTCAAPGAGFNLGGPASFTPLLTTGAAPATLDAAGGANDTRYYVITVDPSGVGTGNQLQNLKLSFDMSFHIDAT